MNMSDEGKEAIAAYLKAIGVEQVMKMDELASLVLAREVLNKLIGRFSIVDPGAFLQEIGEPFDGGVAEAMTALTGADDCDMVNVLHYILSMVGESQLRPRKGVFAEAIGLYERATGFRVRDAALADIGLSMGVVTHAEYNVVVKSGIALSPLQRAKVFECLYFGYDINLKADVPLLLKIFDYPHLADMAYKVRGRFQGYRLLMKAAFLPEALTISIGSAIVPSKGGVRYSDQKGFPHQLRLSPYKVWFRDGGQVAGYLESFEPIELGEAGGDSSEVWTEGDVAAVTNVEGSYVIDDAFVNRFTPVFGTK